MTGTARRVQAARGRFGRLVAVLAVLAGVALAVGLQCSDGMAMPMAHGMAGDAGMACGSSTVMAASDAPEGVAPVDTGRSRTACAAESVFVTKHGSPSSGGLGGVLATCLAFILAVVAAVAAARPGPFLGVVRVFRTARVTATRSIWPRAPSLAELCLLRT